MAVVLRYQGKVANLQANLWGHRPCAEAMSPATG